MLKAGRKLRAFDHPGEYLRDVKPGHNRFFGVDFLAALQHDALCRLTVEQDALYLAVEPDGAAMILETAHQRVCQRRSEEHTSELQSLMRISYAVFCLKKKTNIRTTLPTVQLLHRLRLEHNNHPINALELHL